MMMMTAMMIMMLLRGCFRQQWLIVMYTLAHTYAYTHTIPDYTYSAIGSSYIAVDMELRNVKDHNL